MPLIVSWSGIPPAELKPVLESMELRRFRDERGGLLLDLPRRPLPDPSTKAPVRFRPQVFGIKTPQSVPTFTVDGQVARIWREEKGKVRLKPFELLPKPARREVDEAASRLTKFIA